MTAAAAIATAGSAASLTAGGWQLKDWLAGIGIVVSLGLGIFNVRQTSSLRTATGRLEEFRTQIREPILAALADLAAPLETLNALTKPNADDVSKLQERASELLAGVETASEKVKKSLRHADESAFAAGSDWSSGASTLLETACGHVEQATAPKLTIERVRIILRQAASEIEQAERVVRLRLEDEVATSLGSRPTRPERSSRKAAQIK